MKYFKNSQQLITVFFALLLCSLAKEAYAKEADSEIDQGTSKNIIWYRQPAEHFFLALPVGNGRLGGKVFGLVQKERIPLNEDAISAGGDIDRNNPKALENLEKIRNLIFKGELVEAQALAESTLVGIPRRLPPYQPLGDLWLEFSGHNNFSDYRRELDLDRGIATVTYRISDARFTREIFSSAMDQVLVVRLTCDKPGMISFSTTLNRKQDSETEAVAPNSLVMQGQAITRSERHKGYEGGVKFYSILKVVREGGRIKINGKQIEVEGADAVTLIVAAATDYRSNNPVSTCEHYIVSANRPYSELREAHIRDHQRLFRRVELIFSDQDSDTYLSQLSTDERIERVKNGESDLQLTQLFFQLGRYLLIASSRPGTLPANNKALWNEEMDPEWESKYTINCNIQMNYWPAEVCNLAECHSPLFDLLKFRMLESGKHTAKVSYGCRGFVAHHNTDIWGHTAPVDGARWGVWPMGAAWLCMHLWDHYEFNLDRIFLAQVGYPLLKEAALFFLDYLVEDMTGHLVTGPSISPENTYILPNGTVPFFCMGPSMDIQIVRALFSACVKASKILDIDKSFREELLSKLELLPEQKIGKYGQLQEWMIDYEEYEPQHRHISHLFALFPGDQITLEHTPELAQAARVSLERRVSEGKGTTWAGANFWYACCWARLREGDRAYAILKKFISNSGNIFDLDRWHVVDGNFSGPAAIAEMLLQSHNQEIKLLPALPKAWEKGYVKGLRARGGFEVDIAWSEGSLIEGKIKSKNGRTCRVRCDIPVKIKLQGKTVKTRKINDQVIEFDTQPGYIYTILSR
jgi:alpha-L-fucosidase 2